MSCCTFSRERARLASRVAPEFCPTDRMDGGSEVELVGEREPLKVTDRNECDAATALVRGMAQYLASLEITHLGTDLSFKSVVEEWPDVQDLDFGGFPAASVQPIGEQGEYDGSMQSSAHDLEDIGDDKVRSVLKTANYRVPISVEVWETEKEHRIGICKALEEAFIPQDFRSGLVLRLPFAWNQHAKYTLVAGGPAGYAELQKTSIWIARFRLIGTAAVGRYQEYPKARPVIARGTVAAR